MYLTPQVRSTTKWGLGAAGGRRRLRGRGLGLTPLQIRSDISDFPASRAVLLNRTPVVVPKPPIRFVGPFEGPTPPAPKPIAAPGGGSNVVPIFGSNPIVITPAPIPTPPPVVVAAPPPAPRVDLTTAGTPVTPGYSQSAPFIDSSGAYWQYSASQNKWVNVGTPYNVNAPGAPPAPVPVAATAPVASTTTSLVAPDGSPLAPAAASTSPIVNLTTAASSGYQDILNWLQTDSLLAGFGFAGGPNWVVGAAGALVAWKLTQRSSRRNPRRVRLVRRRR
jgi:hypothetical protein